MVYVQDAGSQLVARLAAAEGLLLDACAAPGGKAMLLADLAEGGTRVVAAEASLKRLASMAASRVAGVRALLLLGADALRPPFRERFDAVLLDAPCSGLGTLAPQPRHPLADRPGRPRAAADRQRALLEASRAWCAPGGALVYATCSLEAEETHQVVDAFLDANAGFAQDALPDWAQPFARDGRVELDPARHPGDGFFAVRLKKLSSLLW